MPDVIVKGIIDTRPVRLHSQISVPAVAQNPYELLHPDNLDFWKRIHPQSQQDPGELNEKSFVNLRRQIETDFPNAPNLDKNLRFLKRCLFGNRADEDVPVRIRQFVQMTKFFGPFTTVENSCVFLEKVNKLSSYTIRQGGIRVSPFAGRLNQDEAEQLLLRDNVTVEAFLVRFSEGHADEGGFSLAVKANVSEIRHYNILGDQDAAFNQPYNARLKLVHRTYDHMNGSEETYKDIVEFMKNRLDDEIEDNIYCTHICPDLPFNALFRGYD